MTRPPPGPLPPSRPPVGPRGPRGVTPRLDYRQMPRRTSCWVDYLRLVHPRERSEVASRPGERTGWSGGGGDPGHGRQARAGLPPPVEPPPEARRSVPPVHTERAAPPAPGPASYGRSRHGPPPRTAPRRPRCAFFGYIRIILALCTTCTGSVCGVWEPCPRNHITRGGGSRPKPGPPPPTSQPPVGPRGP